MTDLNNNTVCEKIAVEEEEAMTIYGWENGMFHAFLYRIVQSCVFKFKDIK